MILTRGRGAPRLHEALGNIALAPRIDLGVDGDAEGVVARVHRLLHAIGHPRIVAAHIELVDLGAAAALDDVLELERRHRAYKHGDVARARAFGDGDAAARLEGFQRADRRQHHRQADLAAKDLRRGIDGRDVAQHARLEGDRIERHAVAPQRRLGLGAADQIVPDIGAEPDLRRLDDLVQRREFAFQAARHGPPGLLTGVRFLRV